MVAVTELTMTLELTFALEAQGLDGRSWVTCALKGGDRMTVGYISPAGDAVAAHGSGEGHPRIELCADPVGALGAVLAAWGRELATLDPGDGDDD